LTMDLCRLVDVGGGATYPNAHFTRGAA